MHLRIVRDLRVAAAGDHLATLQHGDGVGDPRYHLHVVLDHQHGAVALPPA